jgi:hypothetical protein
LPPEDRARFMAYLVLLVETNNDLSRTPVSAARNDDPKVHDQ